MTSTNTSSDIESSDVPPPPHPNPNGNEAVAEEALSSTAAWNLVMALLAWSCTVSNVTLVVGISAVVVLSIGGDDGVTSLPLGTFFVGSSVVSVAVTPWVFKKLGRRLGLFVGLAFGFTGTLFGCLSIIKESLSMLVISMFFIGMATGIGFFWRFIAVELVPSAWAARAVTLVVSGGCLAAFAGPELGRVTDDLFDSDLEYMGAFFMTGIFNILNLLFTSLVQFPASAPNVESEQSKSGPATEQDTQAVISSRPTLASLLKSRGFVIPALVSGLSFAIMSMPMSVFRLAMHDSGFSVRNSLTTIEIHFLGMYGPGFFTGNLIKRYGPKAVCAMGGVVFAFSIFFMLLAESEEEGNMGLWVVGLFLLGVGWNFGFTAATVWTTALYHVAPEHKGSIQSANDSLMFLFGGAWTVSSSYIFKAGGSGLDGWMTTNYVVLALVGVYFLAVCVYNSQEKEKESETAIPTEVPAKDES